MKAAPEEFVPFSPRAFSFCFAPGFAPFTAIGLLAISQKGYSSATFPSTWSFVA